MNLIQKITSVKAIPFIIFVVISISLFAPLLINPNLVIWPNSGFSSDIHHYFWTAHEDFREGLLKGNVQLWNSNVALGYPYAGSFSGLWMYPFYILLYIFNLPYIFTILAAIHLVLGAVFVYHLILSLFETSRGAALIGGITFMLSPKLVAHLAAGHLDKAFGIVWAPAMLLGFWQSVKTGKYLPAVLAGVALAFQLPSHPQIPLSSLYLMIGLSAWFLFQTLKRNGRNSKEFALSVRRIIISGLIIGLVAVLLSAILWLPILELFPYIDKVEFESHTLFWYRLPVGMLLTLFFPLEYQFPEWVIYIGIVPLLISILALLGENKRKVQFMWLAITAAILFSLGDITPFYNIIRSIIPGLDAFRTNTRVWFMAILLFSFLTALGVDTLLSLRFREWISIDRKPKNLFSLAFATLSISGVVGITIVENNFPFFSFLSIFSGSIFVILIFIYFKHSLKSRHFTLFFIGALLMIDLLPGARHYITEVNPANEFLKSDEVIDFINSQPGVFRVYSTSHQYSLAQLNQEDIDVIDAVIQLPLEHVKKLINLAAGCQEQGFSTTLPSCLSVEHAANVNQDIQLNPELLGLMNVKYIVSDRKLENSQLDRVFQHGNSIVYENEEVLPRAFVVSEIEETLTDEDTYNKITTINPLVTALINDPEFDLEFDNDPVDSEIIFESISDGDIALTVKSSRNALLVYSEAWAPGWKGEIDGEDVPILRVDGALMGVIVPSGTSSVSLYYLPDSWVWGKRISAAAVLAITVGFFTVIFFSNRNKRQVSAALILKNE